jgi:hypothetical protein
MQWGNQPTIFMLLESPKKRFGMKAIAYNRYRKYVISIEKPEYPNLFALKILNNLFIFTQN